MSIGTWLTERLGISPACCTPQGWTVPRSARVRTVCGALLVVNFIVLAVTGVFLGLVFSPGAQSAWESVFYIEYVLNGGWFVRGLHHFASQTMVVLAAVFVMALVWEGGYRAPRELSYWTTLLLLVCVLGMAHTGYLLPWDQRGFQAAEVFTNIVSASPVIGPTARLLIQGGPGKGTGTITRLYALHVMIFPLSLMLLAVLHAWVYRRATQLVRSRETETKASPARIAVWPTMVGWVGLSSALLIGLLVVLTGMHHGASLTAPADPAHPFAAARPEWYFLFLFRLLKTELVQQLGLAFGAVHLPGAVAAILVLFPLLARWKFGHALNVAFLSLVMSGVVGLTAVAMVEDARNPDYQHAVEVAETEAQRAVTLALAPEGIPVEGAVSLLRNDPWMQGPQLYAARCGSCHPYHGHDGLGHAVAQPSAADLGTFGSRQWLFDVLANYDQVFANTVHATWEGESMGAVFLEGEMAEWSTAHRELLRDPVHRPAIDDLIEFLYAQSGRDVGQPSPSPEQLARGREMYEFGEWGPEDNLVAFDYTCIDCHSLRPVDGSEPLKATGAGPDLTEYASAAWLKDFIRNPAGKAHYGYKSGHNAMPAFDDRQLTERELNLLVRWMMGDYHPVTDAAADSEHRP